MQRLRSSASQVSLDCLLQVPRARTTIGRRSFAVAGTISVEQSSCCSTETRDDSAHFLETTEGLSVPHLMCWRTEGTFTTARRCCGVFMALDTKLQTYLFLTFSGKWSNSWAPWLSLLPVRRAGPPLRHLSECPEDNCDISVAFSRIFRDCVSPVHKK